MYNFLEMEFCFVCCLRNNSVNVLQPVNTEELEEKMSQMMPLCPNNETPGQTGKLLTYSS